MKYWQRKKEYFLFTACYLVFAVYSIVTCFYNRQIITAGTDGIAQYYPAMCYIADWLKEFVNNLYSGRFVIPLVDYTLGMGDDVLVTLNYYGFGDPFYLLLFLVTEEAMPYFFTILFFARIYLGGLAFILLSKELIPEKHCSAYVLGGIIYTCSGFAVVSNLYYNFVHAFMYIPLMLYGIEMILKNKKKRWTVITVWGFALSGFFYLYVGIIASIAYIVVRYFTLRENIKKYCKKCIIWGMSTLIGIMLSAVILLPEIMGYLEGNRSRITNVPLYYPFSRYRDMFFKLFFAKEANFQVLALPIIAIIMIAIIVLAEKHYKEKIVVILSGICFVLPIVSYAMSGFGAIYDRWEIVLLLVAGLLIVKGWDELLLLTKYQKLGIVNLYLIFLIAGYYEELLSEDGYYRDSLLIFSIVLFFCFLFSYFVKRNEKRQIARWGMFCVAIVSVFVQINNNFRYYDLSYMEEENVVEELLVDIDDETFYRIDNEQVFNQEKPLLNLAFAQDYKGLGEYFSIINEDYISALADWNVLEEHSYHSYGLNHRTILETLCNVKYMVLKNGHEYLKPYGFELANSTEDGMWNMYKNQYSLPIGYTYSDVISYNSYMELDGLEKQQAMLDAVALEKYNGGTSLDDNQKWNNQKGSYEIVECNKVSISEEGNYIAEAGSSMKLLVELKANCENYFILEDVNSNITLAYKDSIELIEVGAIGNLGYTSHGETMELNVQFLNAVTFKPEQLQIGYLSMEKYQKSVQQLQEEVLENIEISANRVSGIINVSEDKILCLALPYMDGWRAELDGENVNVYKANSMFMAIEVPAGEHEVEFIYCTPWLKLGTGISVISFILCIVYYIINKKYLDIK